jgi:hypothetical protein
VSVHPAANQAALEHLAGRLAKAELDLAVAVGNLAYKDVLLAESRAQIEELTVDESKV